MWEIFLRLLGIGGEETAAAGLAAKAGSGLLVRSSYAQQALRARKLVVVAQAEQKMSLLSGAARLGATNLPRGAAEAATTARRFPVGLANPGDFPSPSTLPSPRPTPPPTPTQPAQPTPPPIKQVDKAVDANPIPTAATNPAALLKEPNWIERWGFISNSFANINQAVGSYIPRLGWTGIVKAVGFKTTPTRTVVHYALAVAFGLIKQTRISSVALNIEIDYNNNAVSVSYASETSILTEMLTIQLFGVTGDLFPPNVAKDAIKMIATGFELKRKFAGVVKNPSAANILELVGDAAEVGPQALDTVLSVYTNVARMLGPLAIYDMGDETLYGGRASFLLRAPKQPEPFASMIQQPMLTRVPAPNPQFPAPVDATTGKKLAPGVAGYSTDLRSLVAQALYDPTILPPSPDTNLSLLPVDP